MKNYVRAVVGILVMMAASGEAGPSATATDMRSEKKADETFREQVGCIDGWTYDQKILDRKMLEGMKKWNPVTDTCPLDPGKAAQWALKQMKLALSVPASMRVYEIVIDHDLDQKDIRFYSIAFGESESPDAEGRRRGSWISVVVYFDGTVPALRKGDRNPFFKKL
jgi:hypothetical protein